MKWLNGKKTYTTARQTVGYFLFKIAMGMG